MVGQSEETDLETLALKESDLDDGFFGDKDETPVDMEEVREGMKLVPLPDDICYGEEDDPMDTELPLEEPIVNPFQALAHDHVQEQDLAKKQVRHPENLVGKRKGGGASRGILKRMKANLLAKDSRAKTSSKLSLKAPGRCLSAVEVADAITTKAAKVAAEVAPDVQTVGIVAETGPPPDFSLWTVEDDLLLKNSVEAGAAIEALAKGAMRFSRRFTIRELRERWRALLYDPEISATAAARMVEAQVLIIGSSKLNFSGKHKEAHDTSKKLQHRSVRTKYYEKKRLEEEKALCSFINGFMEDVAECPSDHPFTEPGELAHGPEMSMDVSSPQERGIELPGHVFPEECEAFDTQDQTLSHMVSILAPGEAQEVLEDLPALVDDPSKAVVHGKYPLSENEYSLNETENVINRVAKSKEACELQQESPALLLNADDRCEEIRASKNDEGTHFETQAGTGSFGKITEAVSIQESAEVATQTPDPCFPSGSKGSQENEDNFSERIVDAANPQQSHPDLCVLEFQECFMLTTVNHEFLVCTLNTEDTDVPFFEDSPSPTLSPSSSLGSSGYQSGLMGELEIPADFHESSHLVQPVDEFVDHSERMQENEQTSDGLMYMPVSLCEESLRSGSAGPRVKVLDAKESSSKKRGKSSPRRSSSVNLLPSNTELVSSYFSEAPLNSKSAPSSLAFRFSTGKGPSLAQCGIPQPEPGSLASPYGMLSDTSPFGKTTAQHDPSSDAEQQINQAQSYQEDIGKLDEEVEEEAPSDEELAHFSDVEALILDMDLDPGDDDFSARAESRRTYRSHRRTLIRLEQGANSAMQRALMSHGAIAILYGHHLRYFIKKNEVTIGRFTQDNVVDIDLGKEGRANKVSRRQASIKLKDDGVFYLKNLGRRVLHVNNIAIEKSQRASLNSNCLIEVGGMRFIFEINKKLVKKRVEEMAYCNYDE